MIFSDPDAVSALPFLLSFDHGSAHDCCYLCSSSTVYPDEDGLEAALGAEAARSNPENYDDFEEEHKQDPEDDNLEDEPDEESGQHHCPILTSFIQLRSV